MDADIPCATVYQISRNISLSVRHVDGSNVRVSMTLAPSLYAMNATITHAAASNAGAVHPSAMKRVNAPNVMPK